MTSLLSKLKQFERRMDLSRFADGACKMVVREIRIDSRDKNLSKIFA